MLKPFVEELVKNPSLMQRAFVGNEAALTAAIEGALKALPRDKLGDMLVDFALPKTKKGDATGGNGNSQPRTGRGPVAVEELVRFCQDHNTFTTAEATAHFGCTVPQFYTVAGKMREAGKLEKIGGKRDAKFVYRPDGTPPVKVEGADNASEDPEDSEDEAATEETSDNAA